MNSALRREHPISALRVLQEREILLTEAMDNYYDCFDDSSFDYCDCSECSGFDAKESFSGFELTREAEAHLALWFPFRDALEPLRGS